jgi:hypothetical protein
MAQEPIKKRKLTEAEEGMAKSLEKMKKPLTSMEKMQTERAYKRLIEENKRLNPTKKVGTDMSKVPSAAKKLMELKAKNK